MLIIWPHETTTKFSLFSGQLHSSDSSNCSNFQRVAFGVSKMATIGTDVSRAETESKCGHHHLLILLLQVALNKLDGIGP